MSHPDRMLKRARKLLATAEALIQLGDFESAVSRAYYAMFHAARAALLVRQFTPKSHKGVLTLFSEQFVKAGEVPPEYLRAFRDAFADRSLADYSDDVSFTIEQARHTVEQAHAFVAHMERLLRP